MVPLMSLWLPILVSAMFVFLISFVLHTVLTYHYKDFSKVSDEEGVMDALRKFNIPDGEYVIPHAATSKDMNTTEFKEKLKKGPTGFITFWDGSRNEMSKNLTQWFIYCVVVGVFAAYLAGRALGPGAQYLAVFRFAGTAAFLGYTVALWQDSIWFKRKWSTSFKNTSDGLVYALVTAGTFGWLWPE
ncbi:MAG: hypothetical protein HYY49_11795 [Ignavibacteriales bacterium]|nr:hypothetical protein [Ignavibacteriales bacterium]